MEPPRESLAGVDAFIENAGAEFTRVRIHYTAGP
jgi:hypothetical protein